MNELLTRMFFGGFVRMHVLYHAVKEPIFGVEMMEELARHGYDVGAGTLYPMLHQLEEAGYLSVHRKWWLASSGNTTGPPPRERPPWNRPKRSCASSFPRSCTTSHPDLQSIPTERRGIVAPPNPDRERGEFRV